MTRDAHGMEKLPPPRWKQEHDKLYVQFVGEQKKHAATAKELRDALDRIEKMEGQMKRLRKQIKALRDGQISLPLEEVA